MKCRNEILNIKPYIPGKGIEEVRKEYGLKDIIKLASNENPLGASPKAILAIEEQMSNLGLYPDGHCVKLRAKLSEQLNVKSEQIIVGNGSDEVLKLIGEAYLEPSDEVIIADPTFSEYSFVSNLMGATIKAVKLNDYRHDLDAMRLAVTNKTKIVFICNPNNPTGTIVSEEELIEFLDSVSQEIMIVIDEAYFEYVTDEQYPDTINLLDKYPNIIITRTFSKVHGLAALRIGYGIASQEIISNLNRVKEPFNVNSLAQVAAFASLEDQQHLTETLALNQEGLEYLYSEFDQLGLEYVATETNFILVNVKEEASLLAQKLLKKGIIIRSAHPFGLTNYIRVTTGTMDQNRLFIAALKEVLL